jgi:chromate reductase, NAD(P)H dehydrogenase (quinone)
MNVLGIAGSLRRESHNRALLRAAAVLMPPSVRFTEYERLKLIPPFDEDDEPAPPPAVAHWRDAIVTADAILFATPEYNSTIPGLLKNAIDWASRPTGDRELPVAAAHEAFHHDGTLNDHERAGELNAILAELLDATRTRIAA